MILRRFCYIQGYVFHNIGVLKICYLANLFVSIKKVLVLTKQIEKNWF